MKRLFSLILCMVCLAFFAMQAYAAPAAEENRRITLTVLSDTHLFPHEYYGDNEDYQRAFNTDLKLLKESEGMLDKVISLVEKDKPDGVLICGDLSKDGELLAHERVSQKLTESAEKLSASGAATRYFVTNGNHDINNSAAVDFSGGSAAPVRRAMPEDLRRLYKDFGMGNADELFDPEGTGPCCLSYCSEIGGCVTLLVIDTCIFSTDPTALRYDAQRTNGRMTDEVLSWAAKKSREARKKGNIVIAMCHHGIMPHFENEQYHFPDFVLDDWEKAAAALADAGVSIVFTGHMHANDIASYTSPAGNTIYNIETGSLCTYPHAVRKVTLYFDSESCTVNVSTDFLDSMSFEEPLTGETVNVSDLGEYGRSNTCATPRSAIIKLSHKAALITDDIRRSPDGVSGLLADLLGCEKEDPGAGITGLLLEKAGGLGSFNSTVNVSCEERTLVIDYGPGRLKIDTDSLAAAVNDIVSRLDEVIASDTSGEFDDGELAAALADAVRLPLTRLMNTEFGGEKLIDVVNEIYFGYHYGNENENIGAKRVKELQAILKSDELKNAVCDAIMECLSAISAKNGYFAKNVLSSRLDLDSIISYEKAGEGEDPLGAALLMRSRTAMSFTACDLLRTFCDIYGYGVRLIPDRVFEKAVEKMSGMINDMAIDRDIPDDHSFSLTVPRFPKAGGDGPDSLVPPEEDEPPSTGSVRNYLLPALALTAAVLTKKRQKT
ncbi:MAG: metallophosphoesterase [Ruminococcus sp.]|nr:metallophosphoesterase [Ruminococcus sp.]